MCQQIQYIEIMSITAQKTVSAILGVVIAFSMAFSPLMSVLVAHAQEVQTESGSTTDTGTTDTGTTDTGTTDTGTTDNPAATDQSGEAGAGGGQDGGDAVIPGQIATSTAEDGTGGQSSDIGGTVITGDATATTTVQNELNTNITNPPDDPGEESNSSQISSENENVGELASQATSTADTGVNTAQGGDGTSTIVTGNAVSTANVINLVNTNIFNSVGLILFLNQLFGGGLDLRDFNLSYFFDGQAGASPTTNEETGEPQCTLLTCMNSSDLNVVNTNTATVTNSVIVRAATGANTATSSADGDAIIDTGDAYAAANVLNLVNTNIVNSSYLLVSFNNFGDLDGDVTLPSAVFFDDLFAAGGGAPEMNSSTYTVQATSSVNYDGDTNVDATTGNNTASTTGQGSGIVSTGDAYSAANTFEDANHTYFGGTSVFLLFRVSGTWTGAVTGLPEGMQVHRDYELYEDTSNGEPITSTSTLVMITDAFDEAVVAASDANCDDDLGPQSNCFNSSNFVASSTNLAHVENDVDVQASTGDNLTETVDGTGEIGTGDAYAVANVVNLINTNIVGRNWIFALFNVFGDWNGNIAFGQSALQLTAAASPSTTVTPGTFVTYEFTITNDGDADAEDILLKADFDADLLEFEVDGPSSLATDTGRQWSLGRIARGETKTFSYRARVGSVPSGTSMSVPLTASVVSMGGNGAEASASFTVAEVDVVAPAPAQNNASSPSGSGGPSGSVSTLSSSAAWTPDPAVSVVKTVAVGTSTVPAVIDYKVVVVNPKTAGPAYSGVLTDTLYDPDGMVMYNRSWNLDTVVAGDEITLTYSVEFASSTKPGIYTNVAKVTGMRNYSTIGAGGVMMTPVVASSTIEFANNGQVLGAATSTLPVLVNDDLQKKDSACSAYLSTFLARGRKNNTSEVVKLQQFLNTNIEAGLPETGVFGPLTQAKVKVFQVKMGIKPTSGHVYTLTKSAINEMICGGDVPVLENASTTATATVAPTKPTTKKPVKPKVVAKPKPVEKPVATAAAAVVDTPKSSGIGSWLKGLLR